ERYGAAHQTAVLVGGQSERIRELGHDKLSTYGIGLELTRPEWRSVFRQLVAHGLLVVDIEGHGGLRLGPDCRPVLRGEQRVQLRRDVPRPAPRPPRGAAERPAAARPSWG